MPILYIGNKLAEKGKAPTTIDTLGRQLEEFIDVKYASDKINPLSRILDMCTSVFRYRKSEYVIIDTYSTTAFNFAFLVGLCCQALKIKYIPILHGGNLPYRLDTSRIMSRIFFKRAYKIVSPSGYLKFEFEKRGYSKITVIPNNIEISGYTFKNRETFGPRLLWVRAFDKTYNCEMAVDVLRRLLKVHGSAQLCMVGPDKDGSMRSTMELAEKYGISDKLTITGKMSKKDWHDLAAGYDVFISTTNFDNTPVSLIEAMALGLPVVSTDVGGVPYIINNGKDGYLVQKNNAEAMADCICHIISHPEENRELALRARQKVEQFDWQCVRKQWKEILK